MQRILLIEDNEYMGRMYQNMLSLANYRVELATSGEEGIKKAEDSKPDLILLDVIMPKMNGIQVLEKLKRSDLTKKIPVVILTVVGEQEIIDRALKLGAEGYIIKSSLNLEELLSEIKSYLKN
ncbi:response regulator [Candidatus Daviesbacteria bacterium]|nr:response regulator [Candidatus Daviesbacteria bacterium]